MRSNFLSVMGLVCACFHLALPLAAADVTGRDAFGQKVVSGLVKNEWGFTVQLPPGLAGYHNSPIGIQGHGMIIPIAATGTAQEVSIELFAGYNGTLVSNPGCVAYERIKYADKTENKRVLSGGSVYLNGIEGWRVVQKVTNAAGISWMEEVRYFLRYKELSKKPAFRPGVLLRSFKVGCDDSEAMSEYPGFEYTLGVVSPESEFKKYQTLFGKMLDSWTWEDITQR